MSKEFSYRDYVDNNAHMSHYRQYQRRYAENMRESDKALVKLVKEIVDANPGKSLDLLDIGCSTGNLLRHLKRHIPGLKLTGGDLAAGILEGCRQDLDLTGIHFEKMDLQDLEIEARFDIITVNAVLYIFRAEEFRTAIANISMALKPGGWFLTFDVFHPFEQELAIMEKSKMHPAGHMMHFRPYSQVRSVLETNDFTNITFRPFEIPIDLPRTAGHEDISSYTMRLDSGGKLIFRGVLVQPWCHLAAQRRN